MHLLPWAVAECTGTSRYVLKFKNNFYLAILPKLLQLLDATE
jgi:hypothetical protein